MRLTVLFLGNLLFLMPFAANASCGKALEQVLDFFLLRSKPTQVTVPCTWGVEFEYQSILSVRYNPAIFEDLNNSNITREFGESDFRKLFSFFANQNGVWIENRIPGNILSDADLAEIRRIFPSVILLREDSTGLIRLENWETFDGQHLMRFLKFVLERRGPRSSVLKLRKRPAAWRFKNNFYDRLIPDQLAEEWRRDPEHPKGFAFVNIEFPMQGGVESLGEVRNYLRNLFSRLHPRALRKTLKSAANDVDIHLHMVPKIAELPEGQRGKAYQGLLGLFGDLNDSRVIGTPQTRPFRWWDVPYDVDVIDPRDHVSKDLNSGWIQLRGVLSDTSFGVLTRSRYATLVASDQGIFSTDIDSPSLPGSSLPLWTKLLSDGLRDAKYGAAETERGKPISVVGLEVRTKDLKGAISDLPVSNNGLELEALLARADGESRGLQDSPDALQTFGESFGLEKGVIMELEPLLRGLVEIYNNPRFGPDELRAWFFLPLTDWKNHPVIQRHLRSLPLKDRGLALQALRRATLIYCQHLNWFVGAMKDPELRETPPGWSAEGWITLSRAGNPLYVPEGPDQTGKSMNELLVSMLVGERNRFISSSQLGRLID